MLDNRLKMCAGMVSGKGTVCDVGTDHAYLAAELILSGKCQRVIASDVREGPLEAAEKTVRKYDIADKVKLVLSDGLKNVPSDNVTDVVIAGMGGETISEILDECDWIADEKINLILQPMTKAEVLREWLGSNGFMINEERAVEDGDRVYIVISAVYNGIGFKVSEFKCLRGFVSSEDASGRRYLESLAKSLDKKAGALEAAGRNESALHCRTMARNLTQNSQQVSGIEVYNYLDELYPFKTQEKWDNSGFLVEKYGSISAVMLTLDSDNHAVEEARRCGAELVISHHPVIFDPLRRIKMFSPVMELVKSNIGAICMHTNLDKSPNGTNGVILRKLSEKFEFIGEIEPFEVCGDGNALGYICNLKSHVSDYDFGKLLKEIFGCEYVRMNRCTHGYVERFAFCSGSGGSMLELAAEKGCDTLITGDVKHDVWTEANNLHMNLYDCGHFHTENLVLEELRYVLEKRFPQLEIIISESSKDPVIYIK